MSALFYFWLYYFLNNIFKMQDILSSMEYKKIKSCKIIVDLLILSKRKRKEIFIKISTINNISASTLEVHCSSTVYHNFRKVIFSLFNRKKFWPYT